MANLLDFVRQNASKCIGKLERRARNVYALKRIWAIALLVRHWLIKLGLSIFKVNVNYILGS
jgi:hypothetical protein